MLFLVVAFAFAVVTSIAIAYESEEDGYHTESSFGLVFDADDDQVHQNRDQDLFDEEEEEEDDTFFQHSQKQQRYHHLNGPSPSKIPKKPKKKIRDGRHKQDSGRSKQ